MRKLRGVLSCLAVLALALGLWPLVIVLLAVILASRGGRPGEGGRRLWELTNAEALKEPAVWRVLALRGVPMAVAAVGVSLLTWAAALALAPDLLARWERRRSFELDGATSVLVVVLAPLLEELAFRGVLLTALRRRLPAHVAILAAGVPFAALHLDPFGAMAFAVATGLLAVTTGSLAPGMVLHFLNNAIAVAVASVGTGTADGTDAWARSPAALGISAGLVALGVPAFRSLWRAARGAGSDAP
jgi:membrane protease YdiL (CAAX protease family)